MNAKNNAGKENALKAIHGNKEEREKRKKRVLDELAPSNLSSTRTMAMNKIAADAASNEELRRTREAEESAKQEEKKTDDRKKFELWKQEAIKRRRTDTK